MSEFVCYIISLSSYCVLPIPLFLCKCLNLCSSAAKRKRKMKKELMHILISVFMLLLYQNYWTCFHGGCMSVFCSHLHCQLFSCMKCLGGYLQIFAWTVSPHLCLMSSNLTVVWLLLVIILLCDMKRLFCFQIMFLPTVTIPHSASVRSLYKSSRIKKRRWSSSTS